MKNIKKFNLFVLALAVVWALTVSAGAQAQGKGQTKNADKGKKKSEQKVDGEKVVKEKGAKEKSGAEFGRADSTGRDKGDKEKGKRDRGDRGKGEKYRPRHISDEGMNEWTDGNPPGWSHGEKTGWGGAGAPPGKTKEGEGDRDRVRDREMTHKYPPGSDDWDAAKKEEWQGSVEQSKTRILERLRARKEASREDEESAAVSIENAAGAGVPVRHVESAVDRAVARDMRGEDIEKMTRAMSYGADKGTDYDELDRLIERKMEEGESGDDLAVSIYKEIDEKQVVTKPEEPVKKPWYKKIFNR
ncbi:MAG: hypothetical protein MUF59_00030 [Candidatus Krumholzibacteria bacterium]|nr:hypothetical protein [Candidatus Krumholzibacteria bacterium]